MDQHVQIAAPQMLQALRFAAAMLRQPVFGCTGTETASAARIMRGDAAYILLIINNAIAKAEGDQ